jgi:hypothetical protein
MRFRNARRKAMKHPAMLFIAVLAAVLVVSISAFPARTAPKPMAPAWDVSQEESVQSADVHALVGASFHAVHASF